LSGLTETLNLNLAACYLRTEQLPKCVTACTAAIAVNANSAKAYFRRGQAKLKLGDVDAAEKDVRKASQLAPTDVAIRKELQKVLAEQKRQKQKQAKAFKGFFDKLDIYDDKEGTKKPKLAEDVGEHHDDAAAADDGEADVGAAASAVEPSNSNAAAATLPPLGGPEAKHSDPGKPD
jgi:tetratricopeptide (TPR) repeat protein